MYFHQTILNKNRVPFRRQKDNSQRRSKDRSPSYTTSPACRWQPLRDAMDVLKPIRFALHNVDRHICLSHHVAPPHSTQRFLSIHCSRSPCGGSRSVPKRSRHLTHANAARRHRRTRAFVILQPHWK